MHKFYFYSSLISLLCCITASLCFSCLYGNIQGSVWAAFGALVSALCFQLHSLYFSNKLQHYYEPKTLDRLHVLGFIVLVLGSVFSIWYVFTMVYWKIPIFAYKITPVFPCVFSFITGKWGLHLHSATKEYSEMLTSNYPPLVQTT